MLQLLNKYIQAVYYWNQKADDNDNESVFLELAKDCKLQAITALELITAHYGKDAQETKTAQALIKPLFF